MIIFLVIYTIFADVYDVIRYPAIVMTIIKTDLNIPANGFDDQQYMI